MRFAIRLLVPMAIAGGVYAIYGLGRHGPGPVSANGTAGKAAPRPGRLRAGPPLIVSQRGTDETDPPAIVGSPSPFDQPPDERLRSEYFTTLQTQLAAEPPDPAWSPAAEQQLRATGETTRGGRAPLVTSVACRQTMCRVELIHATDTERATEQERFLGQVGGVFPEAALDTDGGRTVVFLTRPGHALPEPSLPAASASQVEGETTTVE